MRNIVFALILANLGYAAWQRWYADDNPPPPVSEREFGDILLASEFSADTLQSELATVRIDDVSEPVELPGSATGPVEAESRAVTAQVQDVEFVDVPVDALPDVTPAATDDRAAGALAAAEPSGETICMSVGPFRELPQVTSAASNLREDGYEPRQRAGEGEIWSGYWVYIERIESVAAAQAMIEQLHANNITDAYVIPNSDSGTLISLGVFSEIIRASRIREEVRQLGYDATIADRVRSATVYWIDVDVIDGAPLDFERLQPPGRIIRLELRPCADVRL